MTKARNIIIIFVLNYALMVLISGIIELNVLAHKAKEIQNTMRTAADISLNQTQVVSDFLTTGDAGGKYKLKMPKSNGDGFVETDLFQGVYGISSEYTYNSDRIFTELYKNNDFSYLSRSLDSIRRPVRYWNQSRTGFTWYYIPTLALMGTDILPSQESTTDIKDSYGNYIDNGLASEIMTAYGLNNHIKLSGGKQYFNTPINLGVTYLNKDLLSTLFVNNIDMLMRFKYKNNLNTPEGGNGILKGTTYADKVRGDLASLNPINNGSFSFLRGSRGGGAGGVQSYKGVAPSITYKVIDMYDRANDPLLVSLFGANKGIYTFKADYLKSLDASVLNPVTNTPFTKKPIVVAKVTFYMDVVVPYFTLIAREFRASLVDGTDNFIEMKSPRADGQNGTRRISYTRFFAVTP